MSSKRETMPRNESSALAPVAKRQKNGTETQPSLLLEAQPEINRNVYSFLTLKEALILRCTHRQFSNTASQDIFQYSFIMNRKALTERGFAMEYQSYLEKQKSFICRLPDPENLRAYLRNETFENDENLHLYFMCDLVKYSTVDNGEAASILLEDGRCIIDAGVYQYMLRKDFFGMAAVLREDDWVQAGLKFARLATTTLDITNVSTMKIVSMTVKKHIAVNVSWVAIAFVKDVSIISVVIVSNKKCHLVLVRNVMVFNATLKTVHSL